MFGARKRKSSTTAPSSEFVTPLNLLVRLTCWLKFHIDIILDSEVTSKVNHKGFYRQFSSQSMLCLRLQQCLKTKASCKFQIWHMGAEKI